MSNHSLMAYFPDLSPYEYGSTAAEAAGESAAPDLNVGWLEAGQPVPRGHVDPEFIDALLRCCTRPVRLYRGRHFCEFCERADINDQLELDGRKIWVGNGEIRVRGPDARIYTAPTLVAHYVIEHDYRPP